MTRAQYVFPGDQPQFEYPGVEFGQVVYTSADSSGEDAKWILQRGFDQTRAAKFPTWEGAPEFKSRRHSYQKIVRTDGRPLTEDDLTAIEDYYTAEELGLEQPPLLDHFTWEWVHTKQWGWYACVPHQYVLSEGATA